MNINMKIALKAGLARRHSKVRDRRKRYLIKAAL